MRAEVDQVVTQDNRLSDRRILVGAWISGALLVLIGCAKHLEFPPIGTPLSASAKLETSSALKDLTLRYTDSCGHLQEVPLGGRLQEALQESLHRTFERVVSEGTESAFPPDHVVQVDLVDSSFDLNKEALYDRAPAVLHLNAIARVYDRTGTLLRQTDIAVSRQERLRLEQLSRNCDYIIDPFIQDTAIDFATRVALTAKQAAGSPDGLSSTEPISPSPGTLIMPPTLGPARAEQPHSPATASTLRFKALLLDENSDLLLEGGEHIRVRVDVVNTGSTLVENASASLTGTRLALEHFPTTVLRIPPLQPGQTKSLEFVATLPLLAKREQAEIRVIVEERSGAAVPPQTLSFMIAPTGARGDDVDQQVSTQTSTVRHPDTSVIAIGLSSTLTQQIPSRKHASHDAETVAKYFQTIGGVPSSNIALLTDRKATSAHIEKTLLEWLPTRPMKEGTVIIYFSGQAMVSPRGEIMLVPYDGTKTPTSLYRLSALESVLAKLNPKQAIVIFDGKTSPIVDQAKTPTTPRWDLDGENTIRLIAVEGLATGIEDDVHRHGLFTYYLLRGLRGEADTNRDGKVTLGEVSGFVRQKVAWASKSQFGTTQRPQMIPLLKPDDKAADIVLTTLPSLAASETP